MKHDRIFLLAGVLVCLVLCSMTLMAVRDLRVMGERPVSSIESTYFDLSGVKRVVSTNRKRTETTADWLSRHKIEMEISTNRWPARKSDE